MISHDYVSQANLADYPPTLLNDGYNRRTVDGELRLLSAQPASSHPFPSEASVAILPGVVRATA